MSEQLPAPLKMVCRVAGVSRSAASWPRRGDDRQRAARGIRGVLADSPFVGEGHRKVWARLRRERGVYTSRKRVLP